VSDGRLPTATTTGWGAELVLPRLVLPVAERQPDAPAVVDGRIRRTYGEHVERTARLADALAGLGLGPGDRYAVLAANRVEMCELWHAAFFGAGVITPLNTRLAAPELADIVRDSDARVLFVDEHLAPRWAEVAPAFPDLRVVALGGAAIDGALHYEELLAAARPRLPAEPAEVDPVVLLYTGGTTGRAKGVVLSHRAQLLNLYHQQMVMAPPPAPVYLHQSPMFHGAAIYGLLAPLTTGGSMVIIPQFSPEAVVAAVEDHGVTDTQMAPTMIAMLLASEAFDPTRLASLRRLLFGGAPMPVALLERLHAALPDLRLFQGYGMTEAASVLTLLPDVQRHPERLGSVGRAVPGILLEVHDPEGRPVPTGEVGEICVRAGNLMSGYWRRPEETAAALRGGWYHTGDAGSVDADGYVRLVDRIKDMIVTGGENVYSIEVEHVLAAHPAVAQVAVIGVPSEVWGEQVHAVVVLHPGTTVDETELRAHARRSLGGYKVPKSFALRTEPLPVSGAMKVLKRQLVEEHRASLRGQ
jgi:long-chain acyl-CoA synthetase